MTDRLAIVLEGRVIGEIERDRRGRLRLSFEDDYRGDQTATPLSVSMPASQPHHTGATVEAWLWGLLPDHGDVLARWGRRFGVSVSSPFSLLATEIGLDCAGAVQFVDPAAVERATSIGGEVEWLSESDLAERLRGLRSDATSWLGPGSTGQFSLAGAQAKTALHRADGRWGVPTGSTPTTHILKPAVAGLTAHDMNEHLCMRAARLLGLRVATTTIESFEGETAVAVERYDRTRLDDRLVRVHQEDVCQALAVPPARKYQADGGPSPAAIAELLRSTIGGTNADTDLWRFIDALIFNWIIAGTDAHAKNYSLLLSGGQIRLAPMYDLASFLPYDDSAQHRIKLAMKIGDDDRLPRTDRVSAWQRTAESLGVAPDRLHERARELASRTPDAFADAARDPAVVALRNPLPRLLSDLVGRRSERLARLF